MLCVVDGCGVLLLDAGCRVEGLGVEWLRFRV